MFVAGRAWHRDLLIPGAQFFLLWLAFELHTRQTWLLALALMALLSFGAWVLAYRRYRGMADTPTSRIASAAQGYVELRGRCIFHEGETLFSKLSLTPCAWFRYRIERRSRNNEWSVVESGESDATFELVDDSGQCVIDPDGAQVITHHKRVWSEGEQRFTEYLLLADDALYAIGDFNTVGGHNADLDPEADLKVLLAEWKADKSALLERFDLDGSGEIDLKEWQLARLAAKRAVETQHVAIRLQDGVHVLRRPRDRLFLLSNLSPGQLLRRFRLWSTFHILVFLMAATAAVYLLWFGAEIGFAIQPS
ncbi:MAG: hypothetical protein ACREUA_03270 [Burkholderiales bacterium]